MKNCDSNKSNSKTNALNFFFNINNNTSYLYFIFGIISSMIVATLSKLPEVMYTLCLSLIQDYNLPMLNRLCLLLSLSSIITVVFYLLTKFYFEVFKNEILNIFKKDLINFSIYSSFNFSNENICEKFKNLI